MRIYSKVFLGYLAAAILIVVVTLLVIMALKPDSSVGKDIKEESSLFMLDVVDEEEPAAPRTLALESSQSLSIENGFFWRVLNASCPADGGTELLQIQFSEDAQTWENVTPENFDVREVLFIDAFGEGSVEIIALVGESCERVVLRSFTSGVYWEIYDSSLRGAVHLDLVRNLLSFPSGELTLPCDPPVRNLSGQSRLVKALLCEDSLLWLEDGRWERQTLPGLVAGAVDLSFGNVATVRIGSESCEIGSLLQVWSAPGELIYEFCSVASNVEAIEVDNGSIWLWHNAGMEQFVIN